MIGHVPICNRSGHALSSGNVAVMDTRGDQRWITVTAMVTRDRKPIARPPASRARPVFVRGWRRYMGVKAVECAIALDIERESYLRLERTPYKFNNGEMALLALTIGIKPEQFWFQPPEPGQERRFSVDDALDELDGDNRELIVKAIRGMIGK
jgi:hypothetical protein